MHLSITYLSGWLALHMVYCIYSFVTIIYTDWDREEYGKQRLKIYSEQEFKYFM